MGAVRTFILAVARALEGRIRIILSALALLAGFAVLLSSSTSALWAVGMLVGYLKVYSSMIL